jgi:hypothetical protein
MNYEELESGTPQSKNNSYYCISSIVVTVFLVAIIFGCIIAGFALPNNANDQKIAKSNEINTKDSSFIEQNSQKVDVKRVMDYLRDLEAIANLDKNKGSRAIATGYNDSAEYIIKKLKDEGVPCSIRRQFFKMPTYIDLAPQEAKIMDPMEIDLYDADISHNYGKRALLDNEEVYFIPEGPCEQSKWNPAKDKVALVSFEDCPYPGLLEYAEKAKVKGVLAFYRPIQSLFNEDDGSNYISEYEERSMRSAPMASLPVHVVRNKMLLRMMYRWNVEGTPVRVYIDSSKAKFVNAGTYNVLCEHVPEAPVSDSVIVIGAHLDSVPEGPGINDNGSGSMVILEVAIKFLKYMKSKYRIVFGWWGAEEVGLVGSSVYVDSLSEAEKKNILAYLNLDMVGAQNYVLEIGDPKTSQLPKEVMVKCQKIQQMLIETFKMLNKPYNDADWGGNSDYAPFANAGIPAAFIDTGIGEKTALDKKRFGGVMGAPADPCYHKKCDTIDNISEVALKHSLDVTYTFLEKLAARNP